MATNGLYVNAANMNRQGNNTILSAEQFDSQINSLNSNVENLMTIWRGIAANEFKTATDTQIVNLREFKSLLNMLGEKITEGAKTFDVTESENAEAAASLGRME